MFSFNKFRAKRTVVDGVTFASKREADRYCQLRTMERVGVIQGLELQPIFELLPSFTAAHGEKVRAITYIADFRYQEGKDQVVEDSKGFRTPEYKIKRKLFLAKYPQYLFKET